MGGPLTLWRSDSNGNYKWQQEWANWVGEAHDVCIAPDGGIVVVAEVISPVDSSRDALIFKLAPEDLAAHETQPTAAHFALNANYPNPFNSLTRISFELPRAGRAELTLFDITGRRVWTLVDKVLSAGVHETTLDARNLASGVYICRLKSDQFEASRKMIVLK